MVLGDAYSEVAESHLDFWLAPNTAECALAAGVFFTFNGRRGRNPQSLVFERPRPLLFELSSGNVCISAR